MYKTIKVKGIESIQDYPRCSHSNILQEALKMINEENGKIISMHTTEIPQYCSCGAGLEYYTVDLITVIVYETD